VATGDGGVAAAVAARATGLDPGALIARAQSPEVLATARRTSAEFHALQVSQRPTVLIEDSIGDRAVFSGLVTATPMVATIEAMLADVAAYTCHAAHFGAPPQS
jgi:predicted DsbA family dithiol-disulfide isomerase